MAMVATQISAINALLQYIIMEAIQPCVCVVESSSTTNLYPLLAD